MTSHRPPSISPTARDAPAPGAADDDLDEKPPGLSVTQVVASALAAVSSTVLLSYLGVAGTIIGAGVASVLTVVGNNLYTRSILKTRRQMKAAMKAGVALPVGKGGRKVLLPTLAGSHSVSDDGSGDTRVLPAVGTDGQAADTAVLSADDVGGTRLDDLRTAATDGPDDGADGPQDGVTSGDGTDGDDTDGDDATSRRPSRRTLILSAVGVFLVLIVGVTLVEVVAGRPLSEILRGEEGSGTSISHVVSREPSTTGDTGDTTGGTTDTSTDAPSSGTTPSPAPSEVPTPAPTDPPTTVPDPEPTTPVTPDPNPTPGTGGGAGGSGAGSGTDLEQQPGTGTGSGSGSGSGAESVPGTGASGSATS
ncbi:hypothetical protein ACFP63_05930 [Oerskovia jenensis]|uniref:Cell division septation protein DedD n=1 Tax=Oerskovia jenensis TaxID=162169 RepID=A0ABS2LHH9_9CELL|nr:hypothetical protein [Oerskovia jenensis]MBM7479584.1 cell division septation protein DedD [Oerskovia jenensis]